MDAIAEGERAAARQDEMYFIVALIQVRRALRDLDDDPLDVAEWAVEGFGFVSMANDGCFHFSSVTPDRPEVKVFRSHLGS